MEVVEGLEAEKAAAGATRAEVAVLAVVESNQVSAAVGMGKGAVLVVQLVTVVATVAVENTRSFCFRCQGVQGAVAAAVPLVASPGEVVVEVSAVSSNPRALEEAEVACREV